MEIKKGLLVLAAGLALVLLIGCAAPEHARSSTRSVSLSPVNVFNCARIRVQLNGKSPATPTCLLPQTQHGGGVSPYIAGSTSCDVSDVQLFANATYQTPELCFHGVGWANLTSYGLGLFGNWNDVVSSFKVGSWYGFFAWDINLGGAGKVFFDNETCSYIGSTWNDKMSSLEIQSYYTNDPPSHC